MDWKPLKDMGHIKVDGNVYDLKHLRDQIYSITIEATPKYPEVTLKILVQYSSHCISWGPKDGEEIDFSEKGYDKRVIDDKGVIRCFCPDRYELSKNLPSIMETLHTRVCNFTGKENWLTIEVLTSEGISQEYEVYFNLTRQNKRFLRIYVESAYVRDPDRAATKPKNFKRKQRIKGSTLLVKKANGKKINSPS